MSTATDLAHLLSMGRLTHVVDVGANPIDGAPPYRPLLDAQLARRASALTRCEKDRWILLAAEWDAMASEANPSGHLPWKVRSG
jgi:hypothetical protein